MSKSLTRAVAGGAVLGALAIGGVASAAPPSAPAGGPSGAAFTTDINGTVNQNRYARTIDVYLNGGPCNTNNASRLPDGWHEYKVTDPSGKTEFSTDAQSERAVLVSGGVIVASSGAGHPLKTTPCGVAVQVGPFAAKSRTGEYKLWVATKGANFARNASKTDNFKVKRTCGGGAPPPPPPPPLDPNPDPTPGF